MNMLDMVRNRATISAKVLTASDITVNLVVNANEFKKSIAQVIDDMGELETHDLFIENASNSQLSID